MEAVAAPPDRSRPCPNSARRRLRWLWLAPAAILLLLGAEAYRVVGGANFHAVIEGQVYRSAQPNAKRFRAYAKEHGIRTVLNLRGACAEQPWYQEEVQVLEELGIRRVDLAFSSYTLPPVPELRRLIAEIESCERPVLIHCRRGSDRTGLAAACVILLEENGSLEAAQDQLSLRFGHVGILQTAEIGQFLRMYEEWLQETGQAHRPAVFREWTMQHYLPGHCWAEIEPLEMPTSLCVNEVGTARFRVTNRSRKPWELRAAINRGVHLSLETEKKDGSRMIRSRAGLYDAVVAPGASVVFTVAIPARAEPGAYRVRVDMLDEVRGAFAIFGSRAFETEMIVHEGPR